jgi:hypothetical protein
MRSREKEKDRGRPAPEISWRELLHPDTDGLTLIGVFVGTYLVLAVVFLLGNYYGHA